MAEVPISWVTYCADNPARGRWDQAHIARIVNREEWLVPGGFTFIDTPWTPDDGIGRVIIFPCGHYYDHEERHRVLDKFQHDINKLKWSLIIATSDEGSTFEWHKFVLPEHSKLWAMTPRPEHDYPEGTRFIGEGCPWSSAEVARYAQPDWGKTSDIFFAGQISHEGREKMWAALEEVLAQEHGPLVYAVATDSFTAGLDRHLYLDALAGTRLAPAPAGSMTQDSFRFYEALEAQAIPLPDKARSDGGGAGHEEHYWKMIFPDGIPRGVMLNWDSDFEHEILIHFGLGEYNRWQALTSAWWQQHKRDLAYQLHRDVHHLKWRGFFDGIDSYWEQANYDVTVIIPTSPTPSNPDISMIVETVESVRRYLPTAEIFITIDGVRHEQAGGREEAYWEYARRLCAWTNTQQNIVPVVHTEHLHQSGMMHDVLERVTTSLVLYVEHDAPLVGEIDFDECARMMFDYGLYLLRFSHEAQILDVHEHLFLETEPQPLASETDMYDTEPNFVRTIQWSQRPHLAGTDWYRDVMNQHFGINARTMIEDVMHGVVQHEVFTDRLRLEEAWERWRMAVYSPPGNIKRSEHTDGRGNDPKFGMFIAYDGDPPPGGPQPGWM